MAANPLTKKDMDTIEKSLATLKDTKLAILKAKQAGIDVSDSETAANDLEARLLAIKRAFAL